MKTISTKLDNKLHTQFIELCNNEGKCQSEFLRDMIENMFEDEENLTLSHQDPEVKPIAKGKVARISYDDGETWNDIPEMTNVTISD